MANGEKAGQATAILQRSALDSSTALRPATPVLSTTASNSESESAPAPALTSNFSRGRSCSGQSLIDMTDTRHREGRRESVYTPAPSLSDSPAMTQTIHDSDASCSE